MSNIKRERHGGCGTHLYSCWRNMRARCNNKNAPYYKNYGGRGIEAAEEWDKSFTLFSQWARTSGYFEGLSLERTDVNGGYHPENCIWVSKEDQRRNNRKRLSNTTGATGVYLRKSKYPDYMATVQTPSKVRIARTFSLKKYGKQEAFKLAKAARKELLDDIKKSGTYYGENHGE